MKKWMLRIVVVLLSVNAFAQADKFKMGIGDIEYRAELSQADKDRHSYGRREPIDNTRAFVDMLTTALSKTRKFDLVERDRMTEILKEQAMGQSGIFDEDTAQTSGTIQGVDYIVFGAITEYGLNQKGVAGKDFGFKSTKAIMTIDIRIVDASTGSIAIAETVTEEIEGSKGITVEGFGAADDNEKVLSDVMRECANSVANLVVSTIYPVKIVSINSEGTIMLNYGEGFLCKGDIMEVFSQGEKVIDPDTGEVLGNEEELIDRICVTDCQAKFSKAVTEDSKQLEKMKKGMICRKISKKQLEKEKAAAEKSKPKPKLF